MSNIYFGGAFNPIHHGHLLCARAVAEAVGADRVVLIPTGTPAQKSFADLASAADRLAMCQRAVEQIDGFVVDNREICQPCRGYTLDTVRQLKREGLSAVSWLIGADQVKNLPTWHEAATLVSEARLLVVARPGWDMAWETLPAPFQALRENVVPAPLVDISATAIRRRVAQGLPIDFFTPPAVCRYIADKGLYR